MNCLTVFLISLLASNPVGNYDTTETIKTLCVRIDQALEDGNDSEAIELYNRCMELTGYSEPMFNLSSSLYNIALIYFQNGEFDKAEEYITKCISIDSRRDKDSILALRYLLLSKIMYEKGDYSEALKYAGIGRDCAAGNNNYNISGRLLFVETLCREAMAGNNPDWVMIEKGYKQALKTLNTTIKNYHYGAVNPYAGEILYHIGLASLAQGKESKNYFEEAILFARTRQKMRGINPIVEFDSYNALASIYESEGNLKQKEYYQAKADSLSFCPEVIKMGTKMSLFQMEFIRREKERQIDLQKRNNLILLTFVSFLILIIVLLLAFHKKNQKQRKIIEESNANLVKLVLQKDKLINMITGGDDIHPSDESLKEIVSDNVQLPEIKLSKREMEVLALCCKGMISKEIASALNLSVRTVETHKLNIFKKVGVNTTNELIAFAFKSGIYK